MTISPGLLLRISLGLISTLQAGAGPLPGVRHVVVIGYDGLSAAGLAKAEAPNIGRLRATGASSMDALGVVPTVSSPNWASMIVGADPERHGITSNEWKTKSAEYPSVFAVIRKQRPTAATALISEWKGFDRIVEQDGLTLIGNPEAKATLQDPYTAAEQTARLAIRFFGERKPEFTFVQLDLVDHAGHKHGYGSPEYLKSIAVADRLTGDIVEGLKRAEMLDSTVVILTSDHGGTKTGHGNNTAEELNIIWIAAGPGVCKGAGLTSTVHTYDTAATVAWLFGLDPPSKWIGKPVKEAFVLP